jgi:type I restriction enzyme S subunit
MELTKSKFKQTEVGLIPEDWEIKLLDELTDVIDPHPSHRAPSEIYSGIPFLGIGDFNQNGDIIKNNFRKVSPTIFEEHQNRYNLNDGLLGLGRVASIGKVIKFRNDIGMYTISPTMGVLKPTKAERDYIFQILKSEFTTQYFSKIMSGSTRSSVGMIVLRKIPIPIPKSDTEQKAIATALSDVDELIAKLEKLIEKKKAIKQGAIQEKLKPKAHWETKQIRDLARYRRGSFPQPYGLSKWYDDVKGTPFVQVVDVDDNKKLKKETKARISKEGQQFSVFVPKGSIILTIQGSIGRICITDYDTYVDRTLLIFESFHVEFDKYFFMMSIFLKFEIEKEKAPGGIIKTITKEALSSFEISYPPIEEQVSISGIINSIELEIENLKAKLEKLKIIKQGMMQELLTGRTRLV